MKRPDAALAAVDAYVAQVHGEGSPLEDRVIDLIADLLWLVHDYAQQGHDAVLLAACIRFEEQAAKEQRG